MISSELRIGNYVLDRNSTKLRIDWFEKTKVCQEFSFLGQKVHPHTEEIEYLQPIPLTPEWLERAGFVKNDSLFEYSKAKETGDNGIVYPAFFFNSRLEKWMDCHTRITIDYVHQLQNAFFVFTNKELEFNLDNLN